MRKYIRYQLDGRSTYGILEGDKIQGLIHEIRGGLFGSHGSVVEAGATRLLADVKLLYPCEPRKILAVGLNYRSHLGARKVPEHPEIFYKPVSSLQNPGDPIVIPKDATNVHFEGELVAIIGKIAQRVSPEAARDAIFGVTCGNDVSEREWQHGATGKDLQWWRAKGSDTFAPLGPAIVTGLDYGNLLLQTRVNGEVVQKQYTSDLIFDLPAIVSWISQWVTLAPGDAIYTGTPGSTSKLKPGDVVEVDIESIGVLRNPVA